jgi:GWxTD domain-containing protein
MVTKFLRYGLLVALFCLLAINVIGQTSQPRKDNVRGLDFQTDYATFKSQSTDSVQLEIYYRIFNRAIQFIKIGELFKANYEVSVVIFDDNGRQVKSFTKSREMTVNDYARTISGHDFRTSQINFFLAKGKYQADCTLIDRNSGESAKRVLKFSIPQYDSSDPIISGIEFLGTIDTILYDSLFIKGGQTMIPSVSREYSGDSAAVLLYYHEIYKGEKGKDVIKIETQILDRNIDAVYRDTLTSPFGDNIIKQVRKISLSDIKAGQYTLHVILLGRRDRIVDEIKEPFRVYWSPDAMVRNDFETAVSQLKYIASASELKGFKNARTSDDKIKLWQDFWFSRDPTPGTADNEARDGYYLRIEYANERYGILKKEGWRTDRGMIYITYGEPDQIEDYPFEPDSKAYQVWYYYHSGYVKRFIFIDDWGDGDFRLQYPYDGTY